MNVLSELWSLSRSPRVPDIARPHLELSGAVLTEAFANMVAGCEAHGGVERYVAALKLKSALFQESFVDGPEGLTPDRFGEICALMPTVRRRIAPYLDHGGFARIRSALGNLMNEMQDVSSTDSRISAFCSCFPQDREHRFVRDFAGEVLHGVDVVRYPLMSRWIWDTTSNTGVLREIWFTDSDEGRTIAVADDLATFLMLREELAQFLTYNGVFRDVPEYVDMLCAQVYAQYICAQGGTYLRADFSAPDDPMMYARRMLGLDGVGPGSERTRLKTIDGAAGAIGSDE